MIALIIFIIYTSLIFFIKEYYVLAIIFTINIIIMKILKVNAVKVTKFCIKMLPFILFTVAVNIILNNVEYAVLVGIKLILVCNITYIFSKKMTPRRLQKAVENICAPLKMLKVNPKEIGIMVSMGIAFIPIMQKEMQNLKYSLESKGYQMNIRNILKKPNYILVPLITSSIKKVSEIEQSMLSKGYM